MDVSKERVILSKEALKILRAIDKTKITQISNEIIDSSDFSKEDKAAAYAFRLAHILLERIEDKSLDSVETTSSPFEHDEDDDFVTLSDYIEIIINSYEDLNY